MQAESLKKKKTGEKGIQKTRRRNNLSVCTRLYNTWQLGTVQGNVSVMRGWKVGPHHLWCSSAKYTFFFRFIFSQVLGIVVVDKWLLSNTRNIPNIEHIRYNNRRITLCRIFCCFDCTYKNMNLHEHLAVCSNQRNLYLFRQPSFQPRTWYVDYVTCKARRKKL